MTEQRAIRISGYAELDIQQMCYWKGSDEDAKAYGKSVIWWLYLPHCGLGNLANHEVVEHEDGTITVTPSILVDGHEGGQKMQKHGYLTIGIWRDC